MKKRVLIVVDYQNDFVDGSLGFERARELESPICDKIEMYRTNGDDVVFTFDTHDEGYLNTQEGRHLPVKHCVNGTTGWRLYGRIADMVRENDRCFEKITFGSFELAEYLRDRAYDEVELVGLVSNICVISNAVLAKAALPEALVTVDASCTASNDDVINEKVLDVMEGLQILVSNRG